MPLCTVADVKMAARVDPDLTEWDAEIPHLIASATSVIEGICGYPRGWWDQEPAPDWYADARWACIAIAARTLDDPSFDASAILSSQRMTNARNFGDMPTLPVDITPTGALLIGGGYLTIGAGSLVLTN
jgi:hypothetical protein